VKELKVARGCERVDGGERLEGRKRVKGGERVEGEGGKKFLSACVIHVIFVD
jgi:hypothetical protein